ncbi:MAG: hypothetical protein RIF33_03965 [Cyclobacteriaceae bacterium]
MVGAQINHSQIEDYAKKIAETLGDNHFAKQDTINGQEILRLSEVKQINFLVLKNLFERWQEETRNLKSPYFNFKSEKVTKALIAFMNILSQNIEIEKAAFMQLLITAVQDTLYLTLTPFDHFWADLSQGPDTLSTKNLKAKGKYIKQNKHIYDAFIQSVTQAADDKIAKTDALNLLEGLIQDGNLEAENNETIISGLSDIHPFDIEAIYALPEPEVQVVEEQPQTDEDLLSDLFDEDTLVDSDEPLEEEEPVEIEQVPEIEEEEPAEEIVDAIEQEESLEPVTEEVEEEPAEEDPIEEEPEPVEELEADEPVQAAVEEEKEPASELDNVPVEEQPTPQPEEEEPEAPRRILRKRSERSAAEGEEISDQSDSLNKKYTQEKTTINDQLKDDDKVTIADIHETQTTGKMQESISVNQRYTFINELFSGNAEHYNKAIKDIERCESFDDSVELMIQKYAKKLDWNMNSPEVKELLKVIFKRYR